jgi:prefoldin alpha subunit
VAAAAGWVDGDGDGRCGVDGVELGAIVCLAPKDFLSGRLLSTRSFFPPKQQNITPNIIFLSYRQTHINIQLFCLSINSVSTGAFNFPPSPRRSDLSVSISISAAAIVSRNHRGVPIITKPVLAIMSSASANDASSVNIDSMSIDQLNSVKQQQEARLEHFTAQYQQLRAVSARLSTARASLSSMPSNGSGDGREIMIPLTESLYAPGKIVDPNKVLVELGAGFFVEKNTKDAIKVLERKGKLVDANSENVMAALEASSRNVQAVQQAMQGKILEIQARQQGMAYKNSQMEGKQ